MKAILLTAASLALSISVMANAYVQKKQFYPSVVYITKSNPSMAVLYVQALVLVILMGKLMGKIFFGQLRAAEVEHLIERSWYAVTETCLAFTVFRDDFSAKFVGSFTLLLFLKSFHWLAEDRIDYMERSPVIRWIFHFRAISLLSFLGILDMYFISHAYYSTLIKGPSVQLVFGFEYAVLLTMVLTVFVKYVLHTVDLQSENPWLNKAVYMLYTSLVLGFVKVVLYFVFLLIMMKVHTFPLFAIRPMYLTMRSFKKSFNDVIQSRQAIKNMNTLYPDATEEELEAGDNVCIICRESMSDECKKLPCNHIFHISCLRSWFLRQQTCPTCRMDILQAPNSQQTANAAAARAAAANAQEPAAAQAGAAAGGQQPAQQHGADAQNQQLQQQIQNMFGRIWFPPGMAPPMVPPAGAAPPAGPPEAGAAPSGTSTSEAGSPTSTATSSTAGTSTTNTTGAPPHHPFTMPMMPPPMPTMPMMPPSMPPFMVPPPVPSGNLSGLTTEQLKQMEGQERSAVETRLKVLRDIQALLDVAVVQMNQYQNIVAMENLTSATNITAHLQATAAAQSGQPPSNATSSDAQSTESSCGAQTQAPNTPQQQSSQTASAQDSTRTTDTEEMDFSGLEGATGYTPPTDEVDPKLLDGSTPTREDDEVTEVRRRRIQHFMSQHSNFSKSNDS